MEEYNEMSFAMWTPISIPPKKAGTYRCSGVLEGMDKEPLCFVVRKIDGKFLRGARLWKWTRNWRRAALLTQTFVNGFCLGKRYGIESMGDIDLYTVQMPSNDSGKPTTEAAKPL